MSGSFFSKLEDKLGVHQQPLKERLALVMYRLRSLRNKIESNSLMLQRRDKELFDKCVAARTSGDSARANLYAAECAEVRNIAKVVLQSELAIEQLIFKLETTEILGYIAFLVRPVKTVVAAVGDHVKQLMPEISFELGQINETLDGLVVDAGNVSETMTVTSVTTVDAEKILTEANVLAEQKIKSRFPELQPSATAVPT